MGYAFISYSHDDAAFVKRLADQLRKDGVEVWIDHRLIPGDTFPAVIEQEITGCAVFVPVMSPSSKQSKWVEHEGDLARKYQRVVMPIGLDGLRFEKYRDKLCEMTALDGAVSDLFRRTLREACQPSIRFLDGPVWIGHASAVRSIAFSADGGLLATADDHGIRLWDTRSGSGRVLVAGGLGPSWPVEVTVDGQVASAAKHQPGVHLWSPATGALARLLGKQNQVRSMSFSGDGTWLATGGDDGSAHVWSARDGSHIAKLSAGAMMPAWPLAFSPDSSRLAVANHGSDSLSVWTAGTWSKYRVARPSRATALCWNSGSTTMISGGHGGDVQVHSVGAGECELLRSLEPHSGPVNAVACSPNGKIIATAGNDGTVKIIGLVTGEVVQTIFGHEGPVYAVAFSPDGLSLVSAGTDRVIRRWRTKG